MLSFALLSVIMPFNVSADVFRSLPWSFSSGIKEVEYLEIEQVGSEQKRVFERGLFRSASYTQSFYFDHDFSRTVDFGFFGGFSYEDSQAKENYWENKDELIYGFAIKKKLSNRIITWGEITLKAQQTDKRHHDSDKAELYDGIFDELHFNISVSGDWLRL